jgi:hypothetical protein
MEFGLKTGFIEFSWRISISNYNTHTALHILQINAAETNPSQCALSSPVIA